MSERAHAQFVEVRLGYQTYLVTVVVLHELIGISRGDERLNRDDPTVLIQYQGRVVNPDVPQLRATQLGGLIIVGHGYRGFILDHVCC